MPKGNSQPQHTRPPLFCKNVAIITVLGRTYIIFWSIVLACTMMFVGCSAPVVAAPTKAGKSYPPLVAVTFPDQSQSMENVPTTPITLNELDPIIYYVRAHGGDFALGPIRRCSNLPLARFHADVPATKPTPPDESNIYAAVETEATFKKELAAWQQGETERLRLADASLAAFREQATRILAHPADATRTDLNGAIERARLFLNEPRFFRGVKPLRVAIFKTDGIETLKKTIVAKPLDDDVITIIVNDTPDVLPNLHPVAFEAFTAATTWLCAKAEGGR